MGIDPQLFLAIVELEFNKRHTQNIADHRLVKIKGFGSDVASILKDNHYDLVYIDAAHDYESVSEDLANFIPKIKSTGWLGGHDMDTNNPKFAGLVRATFEVIPDKSKMIWLKDSSYLIRKSDL